MVQKNHDMKLEAHQTLQLSPQTRNNRMHLLIMKRKNSKPQPDSRVGEVNIAMMPI